MNQGQSEIRIGISACLLGQKVRFDGRHKRDQLITKTFSRFVTFVPVCPEVEIGLGTPRERLRLIRSAGQVRMVGQKSGTDRTDAMRRYAARKVQELTRLGLSGYILKKDSPSCGMERVRAYDDKDVPSKSGRGLFAEALLRRFPLLPVEEEGRLKDPRLRANFIKRIFAYRRLHDLFGRRWKVADVIRFHNAEKFLLISRDPAAYERLERLLARAKKVNRRHFAYEYQKTFMRALASLATTGRQANVLRTSPTTSRR